MNIPVVHFFAKRPDFASAGDYCLKIGNFVFSGDMKDCLDELRKQFDDHDKISLLFLPPENIAGSTPLTRMERKEVLEKIWADRLVPERTVNKPVSCRSAQFGQPGISS